MSQTGHKNVVKYLEKNQKRDLGQTGISELSNDNFFTVNDQMKDFFYQISK